MIKRGSYVALPPLSAVGAGGRGRGRPGPPPPPRGSLLPRRAPRGQSHSLRAAAPALPPPHSWQLPPPRGPACAAAGACRHR
eukprot:239491-Prorocentrum_minimum.AAC.1